MWLTQISSPQPFRRSQGHCCVANSDLRRLGPSDVLKAIILTRCLSRRRPHCPLLCGWLRSFRLGPSDVLKAIILTRCLSRRHPHCHFCVADSDLIASAFLTFSRPSSSLVASAFSTFSRLPSSLLLLCGWLRSRLSLSDVLKAAVLIATVVWLTQISPQPFPMFSRPPPSLPLLCGWPGKLCWPRLGNFFFLTKNSLKKLIKRQLILRVARHKL